MSWQRRRYTPRNVQLARQGYRPLAERQDLHPLHQAAGRLSPGCPRCQAGDPGHPSPSMEDQHRGNPR